MAEKSRKMVKGNHKNATYPWESSIYSSIVSIFAKEGHMDKDFLEMVKHLHWASTIHTEDDRICSEYIGHTIPLYEYLFST